VFNGCTAFQGLPACTDPASSCLGRDDACALFAAQGPTCAQLWHQPPLKACQAWTLAHAEACLKQHHPSPQAGLQPCVKFSTFPSENRHLHHRHAALAQRGHQPGAPTARAC